VELPLFLFSFALALGWILHSCQNQRYNSLMKHSFEETLIAVWRQALVDEADVIKLGSERYLVTRSRAKMLRQVVFAVDGNSFIGIEQNPKTKSRWAAIARSGKKVMQFIQDGRYAAVVADGK
jgi:carbamate kinase